jgi:hypothetical protein
MTLYIFILVKRAEANMRCTGKKYRKGIAATKNVWRKRGNERGFKKI